MLLFDIGANNGSYAKENSSIYSKIISVEASPITYDKLKHNVASYSNITPLNVAISNSSTEYITFYHCTTADTISTLDKEWLSSHTSRFGNYKSSIKELTVPTISLDKLILTYGIPDLLKIDVEGAENIVIASLSQKVPLLCFEWAAEWREKNKECIRQLICLGFDKFQIQMEDNYHYRPAELNKSAADIIDFFDVARDKKDWGMIWAA